MPNWCSNQIRIEGPAEEIDRIWDIIEDTDTDDGLLTALAPLEGGWEYHTAIDHWVLNGTLKIMDYRKKYTNTTDKNEVYWKDTLNLHGDHRQKH